MKAEVSDTISLRRGAQIIGIPVRAYSSRKANGLVAPICTVHGKERHERQEFKRWLIENAAALGWEQNDARLLAMIEKLERDKMSTLKKVSSVAVAIAIATFSAVPAHAQATNAANVPAGTITIVVPAAGPGASRTYQRIVNSGAVGSGTAWCERISSPSIISSAQFIAGFAAHQPGLVPLAPFGNSLGQPSTEEFNGKYIPQQATACISDGGSSGTAAAQLSIELSQ